MNNCMNRDFEKMVSVHTADAQSGYEKLLAVFCAIVSFFENAAVACVIRTVGAVALAVASFVYVSAVMSGSIGFFAILLWGALIVGAVALVFSGTQTSRG